MSNIKFTIKCCCKQRTLNSYPGFLCIELLQGLLILGVLLLLMSAFHILSVYTQEHTIKRFEALDLIASELSGMPTIKKGHNAVQFEQEERDVQITEFAAYIKKPIVVKQQKISATWSDSRNKIHTCKVIS